MGSAHLTDEQMAVATAESNRIPGFSRRSWWMFLATSRFWIEALTVNHITERKNNPAIVKGGFTAQFATNVSPIKAEPSKGSISTPRFTWWPTRITPKYVRTDLRPLYRRRANRSVVIRAAQDSLTIDRAYRSALAQRCR
jgi:hypothetical protein